MATVERIDAAFREGPVEEGETRVVDARARVTEDSEGAPAVHIELTLTTPPPGRETWPVEDIWALRRTVRDIMLELDPESTTAWFLTFLPEGREEFAPEDAEDEIELE